MLDAVIRLRPVDVVAKLAGDSTYDGDAGVARVVLYACAPERDCEIKLWDSRGRNPELLTPERRPAGPGAEDFDCPIPYSVEDLDGRTVTWSVRLSSPRADSFELRVEVFQGATSMAEGQFSYAGPLDAGEIEERTGRFHFKFEPGQSGWSSPPPNPAS